MSACCLVVRPRLDTDMKPLPPRASSVSPSFQEEGGSWNDGDEEMRREIQAAASLKSTLECVKFESKDAENKGDDDNKDSVLSIKKAIEKVVDKATGVLKELVGEYDPVLGRRKLKNGYACPESDPFPLDDEEHAQSRALLATIPKPSLLREELCLSESMGGRCFDKWGYRWGQRADDVWLYMILPDGLSVTDLRVTFKPHQLGIFVKDVALYDGELWNVGERKGIDVDSSTWSVETEGQFSVLHIEMFKVKSGWWKAVWAGHPTIEPWEVPDWKSATFSDGYRSLN